MTTAHRPTWAPAKGHEEQGGARHFGPSKQYSARDLASHTELKERKSGQNTLKDLEKRDLKAELEEKERKHFSKRSRRDEGAEDLRIESGRAKEIENRLQPKAVDADDSADEQDDDDDDDDDDDEDDTEELMKELERIKKERAEESARKQAEIDKAEQAAKSSELARGNPLIGSAQGSSFNLKRRWDDDVVFKNQARNEPKQVQRFINDTIRNDFHRRFLNKYMK